MAAPKYIKDLPTVGASPVLFTFTNVDYLELCLLKQFKPLTVYTIRQLISLYNLQEQRRTGSIGVCRWYKYSPLQYKSITTRREVFNKHLNILVSSEYIEVIEVARGRTAQLTDKGRFLILQVQEFINNYYRSIFTQFNLIPVL